MTRLNTLPQKNSKPKSAWHRRVTELRDKDFIDDAQQDSLFSMLDSEDKENASMVESISRIFIKDKLSATLNDQQKEAFYQTIDFVHEKNAHAIVLKGYAGTGKTYLVKRIIEYILQTDPNVSIAIAAPTNKAVKVLHQNAGLTKAGGKGYLFEDVFDGRGRVIFSTVHKLLAMKEVITDQGDQIFVSDNFNGCDMENYAYVIIDEGYMIDNRLYNMLMEHSDKTCFIFMGDPAQAPPINQAESILEEALNPHNMKRLELTEIMRQKGDNPIIEYSFQLRNNLLAEQPIPVLRTKLNEKQEGVVHLCSELDRERVRPLINKYITDPKYKEDPDYFKMLAWRRDTVTYLNTIARETLYGKNPPRFMVGERLLTNKPVMQKVKVNTRRGSKDVWTIKLSNSEELLLNSFEEEDITIREGSTPMTFKAWKLYVSYYDYVEEVTRNTDFHVIHEDDLKRFNDFVGQIWKRAKEGENNVLFALYYTYMKYFGDISYNYALTIHKAQGSTYENVLVIEEDLDANFRVKERNRLKYTAYTRASKKLYVLRSNPKGSV